LMDAAIDVGEVPVDTQLNRTEKSVLPAGSKTR